MRVQDLAGASGMFAADPLDRRCHGCPHSAVLSGEHRVPQGDVLLGRRCIRGAGAQASPLGLGALCCFGPFPDVRPAGRGRPRHVPVSVCSEEK